MHRKISVKVESPYETPPLIYAKAQFYYVRDIARYFAKAFPTFGKGIVQCLAKVFFQCLA